MRRRRRFDTRAVAFQAGRDDESRGGADPPGYARAILVPSHAEAYIAGARFQRKLKGQARKVYVILRAEGVCADDFAEALRLDDARAQRLAARRLSDVGPDEEGPWL
jgi:hypothetical protein